MARFLVGVWPFASHYFPLIAIGHALRADGHTVAFYSGPSACPTLAAEGFTCLPFRQLDELALQRLLFAPSLLASWQRPWRLRTLLRAWLLDTLPHQIADLDSYLATWRPDVIVSETSLWAPIVVSGEAHGIPVAVFSTVAGCLLPGPDAPPYGPGLPRAHGAAAFALQRGLAALLARQAKSFLDPVNRLRARRGLAPITGSVTEHAGQMALYLMPSVPAFDYQRRDLPPTVQYVGPCLWQKPHHEPGPPWLAQLSHEQPLIHVTEGTTHTQRPFVLQAAAQAFAGRPYQVVLTTGPERDPATLGLAAAPNIRVERWVAHSDLLPHADLLVTTGGAGTVMAALNAGVPLVVVPTEWDKPENAQRVVEAGVGLRLSPWRCGPRQLRHAAETVLAEPRFRSNARRLSGVLASYNGPQRAAELLGQLADAPTTVALSRAPMVA